MSKWFGSKKWLVATSVVAMSSMLLFTVCSDDDDDGKKGDDGTSQYCGWTPGDPTNCQLIEDGMSADNPGMTNLQACQEYGTVYDSESACKTGEANKDPVQYCGWTAGDPTNCQPINKPNDVNPENPTMTNLEACEAYGTVYASESACVVGETNKVVEYCDWGPLDTSKPAGEQGGCWVLNEDDRATCEMWGEVVSECPRGVGQ